MGGWKEEDGGSKEISCIKRLGEGVLIIYYYDQTIPVRLRLGERRKKIQDELNDDEEENVEERSNDIDYSRI